LAAQPEVVCFPGKQREFLFSNHASVQIVIASSISKGKKLLSTAAPRSFPEIEESKPPSSLALFVFN